MAAEEQEEEEEEDETPAPAPPTPEPRKVTLLKAIAEIEGIQEGEYLAVQAILKGENHPTGPRDKKKKTPT